MLKLTTDKQTDRTKTICPQSFNPGAEKAKVCQHIIGHLPKARVESCSAAYYIPCLMHKEFPGLTYIILSPLRPTNQRGRLHCDIYFDIVND